VCVQDLSEDDMSDKEEEGGTYRAKERKQSKRSTIVDDQFFKLSEMSKFLDLEDQRENKRRQKEDEQNREGMLTFFKRLKKNFVRLCVILVP
jgi:hypothetical protein